MRDLILCSFFLILFFCEVKGQTTATPTCAVNSKELYNETIQADLEHFTQNWIESPPNAQTRSIITIPVVVHIVWRTAEENITEEQIHSQIAALNRDFQLLNDNLDIIPALFESRVGKAGFAFCLATIDENGEATTGITRTQTRFEKVAALTSDPFIYYTEKGGKDAWDTQRYLNIWVADMSDGILGYGSRPGSRVAQEDGLIIPARFFGTTGTVRSPYNQGRTATHEVGHYFNLRHLNGDNSDCELDDMVKDTPTQDQIYAGCSMEQLSSCGSIDMLTNYMNNRDGTCMAMFTAGQVQRMQAALFGARASLLDFTSCEIIPSLDPSISINIRPNPTSKYCFVDVISEAIIPYRIIDPKGAIIQQGKVGGTSTTLIEVTNYRGLVFIQFLLKGEAVTRKLLLL